MRMITATEANRDFSKLLEQVENGDSVNITKHGKIIASIVPAKRTLEDMERLKQEHLALLRSRKPFTHVKERGTREELYEDIFHDPRST
jgi:prevent-host-death family protein